MAESNSEKVVHVDYDGRTIVDVNALLRDPKVIETIERVSKSASRLRNKEGVTFVRPPKRGN